MPTADYSPYHQPPATGADGTKLDNFIDAVQATVNGLDNNNIAVGAGIVLSKVGQSAAASAQVPVWNGSAWVPAYPPGYEFSYDEFTVAVNTAATTEATATTIKTATAVTFDGSTSVWIEFFCPSLTVAANAAGNACFTVLYEDGVSIGKIGEADTTMNGQVSGPLRLPRRRTPTAGSHTYSIRGYHTNAACGFNAGLGGVGNVMPGYIRITKV